MNEDYLKQFRKLPDANLVEKIHSRLEKKARRQTAKRYSILSVLALMFLFSMFMIFSSPARAEVLYTLTKPQMIKCIFFSDKLETQINCDSGDGILATEPSGHLSLEEAQAHFASPIVLPTYVPQNFKRQDDVELFNISKKPTLVITWEGKNSIRRIKLVISHNTFELKEYAQALGKGAIEDTLINGKPAILVRGVWNISTQQSDFIMTALMWRYDENTVYSLLAQEHAIPPEELRKIAESIR